jgi:hypothetical protein
VNSIFKFLPRVTVMTKHHRALSLLLSMLATSMLAAWAQADVVFDAAADFYHTLPKPAGNPWTYGVATLGPGGAAFTPFASSAAVDGNHWRFKETEEDDSASLTVNFSPTTDFEAGVEYPPGAMVLRPRGISFPAVVYGGEGEDDSVTITIDFSFTNRTGAPGTNVLVLQNGVEVIFSGTTPDMLGGFTAPPAPLTLDLAAGSTIDFIVTSRTNGSFDLADTQLMATITQLSAVPEAPGFLCSAVALAAALTLRRFARS